MSFAKGGLVAFAIGFCVPILMAIAYWSFFEHHPSRFVQTAEPIVISFVGQHCYGLISQRTPSLMELFIY